MKCGYTQMPKSFFVCEREDQLIRTTEWAEFGIDSLVVEGLAYIFHL